MPKTRYHLAYADTLDARCAAAIAKKWALDQLGGDDYLSDVLTYPLPSLTNGRVYSNITRDMQASGKYASLLTRIKAMCGDRNGQRSLSFGDHDPANEQICVIGAELPFSEMDLLNTWGQLSYFNHQDDDIFSTARRHGVSPNQPDGVSTCELTWSILYLKSPLPLCVQLIGRHTMSANVAIDPSDTEQTDDEDEGGFDE